MIITLASSSPRRRELIKRIAFAEVTVAPSNAEERAEFINPGWYACALARTKAFDVSSCRPGVVVGADTIVVADGKLMGKPRGRVEAEEMLAALSDKTHSVITGVCVTDGKKTVCRYCETFVSVGRLSDEFIKEYVATGSPLDKAGAYGIQDEEFAAHVTGLVGDRDNVIGLPVSILEKILKEYF